MEFFRLTEAKPGIGNVGDFAGLEVNMRPAGGYTPDMFNYAGSLDVYQIWADMVSKQYSDVDQNQRKYYCVYAGRRDGKNYRHSDDEVMWKYGSRNCNERTNSRHSFRCNGKIRCTLQD